MYVSGWADGKLKGSGPLPDFFLLDLDNLKEEEEEELDSDDIEEKEPRCSSRSPPLAAVVASDGLAVVSPRPRKRFGPNWLAAASSWSLWTAPLSREAARGGPHSSTIRVIAVAGRSITMIKYD